MYLHQLENSEKMFPNVLEGVGNQNCNHKKRELTTALLHVALKLQP
jgi:hypothetical protein